MPHQECALRVTSVISGLRRWGRRRSVVFDSHFSRASDEQLRRVHSARYLQVLQDTSDTAAMTGEPRPLTPPPGGATRVSGRSFVAASRAAGAACAAVDRLLSYGSRPVFFCAVRPPGHHACRDGIDVRAGGHGFSLLNSVAIAAAHALATSPHARVAIVDFDVHHGNGTELWARSLEPDLAQRTMYASVHLREVFDDPDKDFFPGSGALNGTIIANNGATIVNAPLKPLWAPPSFSAENGPGPSSGSAGFRAAIEERITPALRIHNPTLVIFSAGFDGAEGDEGCLQVVHELSNVMCSLESMHALTFRASSASQRVRVLCVVRCALCVVRVQDEQIGLDCSPADFAFATSAVRVACTGAGFVSVLEGGYGVWDSLTQKRDYAGLIACAVAHVSALSDGAVDAADESSGYPAKRQAGGGPSNPPHGPGEPEVSPARRTRSSGHRTSTRLPESDSESESGRGCTVPATASARRRGTAGCQ